MSDFKVIHYKKSKNYKAKLEQSSSSSSHFPTSNISQTSLEYLIKRIKSAKEDLISSVFYQTFIKQFIQEVEDHQDINIVSYALGQFSQCVTSRFQFAFLLALRDHFNSKVEVYDPAFGLDETAVLKHFECYIIDINEEGKRFVSQRTVFFLPHCPKQLTNNLLWKNWGTNLANCVIIGNSFEKIVESHSDRVLKDSLLYIYHASQFVSELKIDNSFKFSDIFNDLSIHIFLEHNICTASNSVVNCTAEPVYKEDDIEFITYSLESNLSVAKYN